MPIGRKIKIDKIEFLEIYSKEKSVEKIAKMLGYEFSSIRKWMKNNNIPLQRKIKYTYDEDFFTRENEEVFYWAGFIAADGCVLTRKKKFPFILKISLGTKDIDHLYKLEKTIKSTSLVKSYLSECGEICIYSEKICNDLNLFNIVPRKSLIYTFPKWLVKHELVNHFIRGYIDGDGSFGIGKSGQKCLSIRGTKEFLLSLHEIFYRNCDLKSETRKITMTKNIGGLGYYGNIIVPKLAEFIYRDATVYLERKYNIAFSYYAG